MSSEGDKSLVYAKVFFVILFVTIFISLAYKTIVLFKNASFKDSSYNLLLIGEKSYVMHIDAEDKEIILLEANIPDLSKDKRVIQSAKLGILIDGVIVGTKDSQLPKISLNLILPPSSYKFSNVNAFDIAKIVLQSYLFETENKKWNGVEDMGKFSDRKILEDQISTEVINSSGIDGLASQFSQALKNTGYNVVSVDTEKEGKSGISSDDPDTLAAKRLYRSLGIKVEEGSQSSVADIKIVLGEDLVE